MCFQSPIIACLRGPEIKQDKTRVNLVTGHNNFNIYVYLVTRKTHLDNLPVQEPLVRVAPMNSHFPQAIHCPLFPVYKNVFG